MTSPAARDPVHAHFSEQASTYATNSASWPWSTLRTREVRAVLLAVGEAQGVVALELGCGAGHYTRALLHAGAARVVAVDRVEAMLGALPTDNVQAVLGDAATVQIDERFSLVLSAGMLEFVDDPSAVFRNAARHADAGARLVVLAPRADVAGKLYRAWHARHGLAIHLFSAEALQRLGADTGWLMTRCVAVAPFNCVATFHATGEA